MYAEITAAVQAAKSLFEIVKANKGLTEYNEIVAAVSEVNTKLMDATAVALASQEKQSLLTNKVAELEKEIMELKNWNHEAKRYILTALCTDITVYTLKPGMENGEPPHKLCTACFGKKQKGYLQSGGVVGSGAMYKCNLCEQIIYDHSQKPPRRSVDMSGVFQR